MTEDKPIYIKILKHISDDMDGSQQLTENKVLALSKRFVSKLDLRDLAITGLNMDSHIVNKHINKSQGDTTAAAYSFIKEWKESQPNERVAYTRMNEALTNIDKSFYKQVIQ